MPRQVLGLTNYSRWGHAKGIRACVTAADRGARQRLLDLARKKLGRFVHVGVTEMLEQSIASLAATLSLRMNGPSWQVPHTPPGSCHCECTVHAHRVCSGACLCDQMARSTRCLPLSCLQGVEDLQTGTGHPSLISRAASFLRESPDTISHLHAR